MSTACAPGRVPRRLTKTPAAWCPRPCPARVQRPPGKRRDAPRAPPIPLAPPIATWPAPLQPRHRGGGAAAVDPRGPNPGRGRAEGHVSYDRPHRERPRGRARRRRRRGGDVAEVARRLGRCAGGGVDQRPLPTAIGARRPAGRTGRHGQGREVASCGPWRWPAASRARVATSPRRRPCAVVVDPAFGSHARPRALAAVHASSVSKHAFAHDSWAAWHAVMNLDRYDLA